MIRSCFLLAFLNGQGKETQQDVCHHLVFPKFHPPVMQLFNMFIRCCLQFLAVRTWRARCCQTRSPCFFDPSHQKVLAFLEMCLTPLEFEKKNNHLASTPHTRRTKIHFQSDFIYCSQNNIIII